VLRWLRDHLGRDPRELPTTGADLPATEQANLQLAIEAVLPGTEILGFTAHHHGFGSLGLAELLAGEATSGPISAGPVQRIDVEVGDGRVVACVAAGIFLAVHRGAPVALALSRTTEHPMAPPSLKLEGVSPEDGVVSDLIRALRSAMREHSVFRGRIISLHETGERGTGVGVQFHAVPPVERAGVILPEETLERLERHTIGVAANADRLRAAGRTSSAACCSTGRRARVRRCRSCTCSGRWPAGRRSC
jgi:hypothetical protein